MKARQGVTERLNLSLTVELTAINQYLLYAEMSSNWGYPRLGNMFRQFQQAEVEDAQKLVKHILYLEGEPNVQRLNIIDTPDSMLECLEFSLNTERDAVELLRESITHCASPQVWDYTTRGMLEEMIREEEEHVDWFETQLETIEQVGLDLYLAQQMRE